MPTTSSSRHPPFTTLEPLYCQFSVFVIDAPDTWYFTFIARHWPFAITKPHVQESTRLLGDQHRDDASGEPSVPPMESTSARKFAAVSVRVTLPDACPLHSSFT